MLITSRGLMMFGQDKVSIIIPVYVNSKSILEMTIDCLRDVMKTVNVDYEIIMVDDGSKKPIAKIVNKLFPDIKVVVNESNMGFAKTVNNGIRESTGNLICLLNNDIKLPNNNWLSKMKDSMSEFDLTAPAGGRMDSSWNYIPGEATKRTDEFAFLVGWALLVKKEVFDKIGLMPEDFGTGFFEDVLFSYKAKESGFKLGITEGTGIEHLYHATFKDQNYNLAKEYEEKRKIFLNIIGRK